MDKQYKGVLAIDFDNTIADTNYPTINGLIKESKKYINKLYNDNWYIIIWTCRADNYLKDAINFLDKEGIKYHLVNEHCPRLIELYENDTRKISADFYIDDKNIYGLPKWKDIYNFLSNLGTGFKTSLWYDRESIEIQ